MAKKKQPTRGGRRAAAGRPRVFTTAAKLSVLVEADMLRQIDERAAELGINRSAAIQLAITAWLKEK